MDMIVCQRCKLNGAKEKFPDPDAAHTFLSKFTHKPERQIPLATDMMDSIDLFRNRLLAGMAIPPNLLGLPIANHRIVVETPMQLNMNLVTKKEREQREQFNMARKQQGRPPWSV